MKRHGNLWPQIIDFGNLLLAAQKAQRGKRYRQNVLYFNSRLDEELLRLQEELEAKTYRPGEYKTFQIVEPKKRMISAAPYRDRVAHHALCNVIAPIFERGFIADSYANRKGYGTHRALRRFTEFARSSRYVLQCDIRQYFPSIDHRILKSVIRRKIKCAETLWLIDTIIDASNEQDEAVNYFPGDELWTPHERRRGLPIGNLTSQFFANVYLDGLDHFVKQELRLEKYLRYVDDFAGFDDDRDLLLDARRRIEEYVAGFRLKIHPIRVVRGGSWNNDEVICRSARRGRNGPGDHVNSLGVRVVVSASTRQRRSRRKALRRECRKSPARRPAMRVEA